MMELGRNVGCVKAIGVNPRCGWLTEGKIYSVVLNTGTYFFIECDYRQRHPRPESVPWHPCRHDGDWWVQRWEICPD